ncbi:programmed cell death [Babesia ovis]|uniref:Programmed cell death n=1 Tax=Babesia ovis TaxID=5869 RepID=A0A9W5TC89_BABOV|nr:programmed cell death [Babesia ovis]
MQLATPYKEGLKRFLVIYYCPEHAEHQKGWYTYRYTLQASIAGSNLPKTSAFDEMNQLSGWVSDLDLSSKGTFGLNSPMQNSDAAQRIIVEEDYITPTFEFKGIDHERLIQAYKHRDRADLDEEDHMDFDQIDYNAHSDNDSDTLSDDSDDQMVDPLLLEFQYYVSLRPTAILRYDWNGLPLLLEKCFKFSPSCAGCGNECTFEFQLLPPFTKQM